MTFFHKYLSFKRFAFSTPEKFSQHLIFILNDYAFHDNIHVGNFVKYICGNIHNILNDENKQKDDNENKNADDHLDEPERKRRKLNNDVTEHLDEDQILKSASLSKEQLSSLKVKDKNNKDVLFCDTGNLKCLKFLLQIFEFILEYLFNLFIFL